MVRVDLAKFTTKGLEEFKMFLHRVKFEGSDEDTPYNLLSDPKFSTQYGLSHGKRVRINTEESFSNQLDFAKSLCSLTKFATSDDRLKLVSEPECADWLSLAYFKQICSRNPDNTGKVLELARYQLDLEGRQKIYRHLIIGVVAVYHLHKQHSRLFLYGPLHKYARTHDVVASKEEVMLNSNLVKVIDELYWDEQNNRPKVNTTKNNPPPDGALYRFLGPGSFHEQFKSTHDFWTMSKDEIISLLKGENEFNSWMIP